MFTKLILLNFRQTYGKFNLGAAIGGGSAYLRHTLRGTGVRVFHTLRRRLDILLMNLRREESIRVWEVSRSSPSAGFAEPPYEKISGTSTLAACGWVKALPSAQNRTDPADAKSRIDDLLEALPTTTVILLDQ